MATAMECEEEELDATTSRYDCILKRCNESKRTPPPPPPPQDEPEDEPRWLKDWNKNKKPRIYNPPPDEPKWRGPALRFFMSHGPNKNPKYSIAQRAKDIACCFQFPKWRPGYSSSDDDEEEEEEEEEEHEDVVQHKLKWKKELLDELEAYDGESIDVATGGYLFPFLYDVLSNKHACLRAKAAQLITSMVQNHPTTQQLVIEGKGIQLLLHIFTTDPDATSRTKALAAISSLIRNNKSGITVFLRENGYEALRNASTVLQGSSTHNEVVNLIEYLRRESSSLSDDSEVQEARKEGGNSGLLGKNDDKPKQDNSKKRRNYYSSLKRLKQFNHLPPFQKKGRSSSSSSSKRMKLH